MILPSSFARSFKTAFKRSSNSPRYLAPAISAPRPSTTAVLPTPGSPINTGLFLVLLCRTSMVRRISSSRPITGSNLPFSALSVKSIQYFFKAPRVFSAFSSLTFLPPRISFKAALTFAKVKLQRVKISFNSGSPSIAAKTNNSDEM